MQNELIGVCPFAYAEATTQQVVQEDDVRTN